MDDDIEAIIETSKHFKYHEPSGITPFNRMSSLPESKKHLKRAIKERIRLLASAYLSLATFIDDELVDFLEDEKSNFDKEKIQRIYMSVIENTERLKAEIEAFKPTEIPTP